MAKSLNMRGVCVCVCVCMCVCMCIFSGSDSKESACNAGEPDSIPGSGRSPGEGNLQYSWLENIMDRGAWPGYSHRVGHD